MTGEPGAPDAAPVDVYAAYPASPVPGAGAYPGDTDGEVYPELRRRRPRRTGLGDRRFRPPEPAPVPEPAERPAAAKAQPDSAPAQRPSQDRAGGEPARRRRLPLGQSVLLLTVGVAVGLVIGLGVGGPAPDDWSRADGARDNPFPTGTAVVLEDYEVRLGEPREAWAEIEERNAYNEPPAAGSEYYIVPVTVGYGGDDEGRPWDDIRVEFVAGRSYAESCGLVPDDLMEATWQRPLDPGGTVRGNVCVAVPAGAEGVWAVREGDGDRVHFVARDREY